MELCVQVAILLRYCPALHPHLERQAASTYTDSQQVLQAQVGRLVACCVCHTNTPHLRAASCRLVAVLELHNNSQVTQP